jgi:MFS family permease
MWLSGAALRSGRAAGGGVQVLVLLAVFVGSFVCARSETLELLVAGRVVQALGAGVLHPVALAGASTGDQHRRLVRVGVVAAVAEAGAVCGPIYGAGVLATLDWRWAFWINLPVVAAVAAVATLTDRSRLPRLPFSASALIPSGALGAALGGGFRTEDNGDTHGQLLLAISR